ncbi:MAG: N-6 DNA methylase, partial [Candidatus Obscuribacterales bacterium]|nr:N-6 DNA methylase [Candidatus Obscuribacterales bacterium]
MRSTGGEKSLKKKIANFRLTAAAEVLKSSTYTAILANDIHYIHHIAELCDQYSLLIILNWLSTKYGFPICTSSIYPQTTTEKLPLLSWASLANRYPLQVLIDPHVIESLCDKLYPLAEQSFSARLELIGDIYQQVISSPLSFSDEHLPYIDSQSDQRVGGEFYTPAWVADYAMEQWFQSVKDELLRRMKSGDKTLYPRLLDPSCGCGNFLLAGIRFAEKQGLSALGIRKFVETSIHGKDIDGRAIELAKFSVLISLSKSFQQLDLQTLENDLEQLCVRLDENIRVQDSLLLSCASDDGNRFDLVITNPPYISFGSRDQQCMSLDWQQHLRKRFPASSEYKIRYTSIFQEIGIDLSSLKGAGLGQCIYLVPDAFLTGSYYQKLRQLILDKVDILSLTELPEDTIGGATVGRWCLAQYQEKSAIIKSQPVRLRSINKENVSEFQLDLDDFVSKDRNRFQLVFSNEDKELLSLCRKFSWLGEVLSGHTGIRSRIGQAAIVSKSKCSPNHKKGIRSGAEVTAFHVEWNGCWLEVEAKKLFAGGFNKQVIEEPKIMLRQTGDRLVAAADYTGLYHLNNVHSFVPRKSESRTKLLNFYVALLNSSFYLYFYRLKTREHKRALAQIDIETVEHLPLPPANSSIENEIELLSAELAMLQKAGLSTQVETSDAKAKRKFDSSLALA